MVSEMCWFYYHLVTPLDTCKDSTARAGVMTSLNLSPILTNGSYSKYIHIIGTGSCKVKTHFQFGNSLQINNVSLTSTCLTLKINELSFPGLVFKLVLFPNIISLIPGKKINLFLQSHVNQDTVELGNFVKLLPNTQLPSLQAAMFADENGIFSILNPANISLFDVQIPTAVSINDDEINFSATANIFQINSVGISGKGTTSREWNSLKLKLNVDTSKALSESMTQYARNELNKQAEESVDRIYQSRQNLHEAKGTVDDVKIKLASLKKQLKTFNGNVETKMRLKKTFKSEKSIHERQLHDLLETYWNASNVLTDSIENICQIKECEQSCRAGDIETLCFTNTFIYESKTCNDLQRKTAKISKEIYFLRKICIYQNDASHVKKQSERNLILFILSPLITPIPVLISILTSKKTVCHIIERKERRLVYEYTYVYSVISKQCNVKRVGNQAHKRCNYTSDCAVFIEDSACSALNAYCYNNQITIN